MSASSQATGTNELHRTISVSTAVTICGWAKVNAFDKGGAGNFGNIVTLELPSGGGAYRIVALQQDPAGDGSADFYKWTWFNDGTSGTAVSTGTPISATGVWTFLAIVVSGTSNATADFYWGTETGALSHEQLTTDFSAAVLTNAILASDFFTEISNTSYRGWRTWLAALNSTELTAERNSTSFAPVRATNLDSDIRIVNGTSPETATTGGNWTRTGTFADDASNPSFPSAPVVLGFMGPGPVVPGEFNRLIPPFWPPSEIPRSTARATNQTFNQSLSAAATASASLKRQVGKSVSAVASAAAARVIRVGKACAATALATAAQVRQVGKLLALTATATPTLLAQKTFTKALNATASASATLSRQVSKGIAASATATAARAVQVGKACAATATSAAAAVKQVGKRVAGATASATASLLAQKAIGVALNASASASASLRRQVGKSVAATSSSAAAVGKAVSTRLSAASSAAAGFTKRIGKALSAASSGTAAAGTNVQAGGSGNIVSQSLTAVATATARLVLGIFPKVFQRAPVTHRSQPVDLSSDARRAMPEDLREK